MRNRVAICVLLAVLAVAVALGTSAEPATPVPLEATPVASPVPVLPVAFPADALVYGTSYGEWTARYWQWLLSLPVDANPALDASGASCGYGQSGPVFFVPPNLPPCTVPAGTAVMVHIAGDVCSSLDLDRSLGSEEELRACAAEEADRYANIAVQVDGQPVGDIAEFRFASAEFPFVVPEPNILGAPGGIGLAASDGYWLILLPLAPGEHEVTVHLELADGLVFPDEYLHLRVVEPSMATPTG